MASELGTLLDIEKYGGLNPVQKARLDTLRAQGGEGRPDGVIQAPDAPTTYFDTGRGYAAGTEGTGVTPAASINLPEMYKGLTQSSNIGQKQEQLSQYQKEYTDATAKINDNPFLSEATRVGRVAKLDQLYQDRTRNLQNDIAVTKADIETQLNLQTKQFDINSQQAQQAMSQFNNLLASGALDNASGQDIANIVRSTGMSSSMVNSAIEASKASRTRSAETPTQTIQFDDGTNTGYAVINSKTGEIINKQIVAESAPTAAEQKAALKTGGGSGGGLTAAKKTSLTTQARKSIASVDRNKDKLLSLQEYKDAVAQIMTSTGVDFATADDYATKAFTDLGYNKWKW